MDFDYLFNLLAGPLPNPKKEEDGEKTALAEATDVLTWSQHPYYAKFMEWLDAEIDKPIPLTKEMATIEAAVRSNTLKEVRQYLRNRVRESQDRINAAREEQHA